MSPINIKFTIFKFIGCNFFFRIRQSTFERLKLLSGGGLSDALATLLAQDPISPVLSKPHLSALDRRVHHVLAIVSMCEEKNKGWHNVLFWWIIYQIKVYKFINNKVS